MDQESADKQTDASPMSGGAGESHGGGTMLDRLRALKAANAVHIRLTADQLEEFQGYYFRCEIATLIYAPYGDQGEWQAVIDRPSYVRLFGLPRKAE
ncbi:hypothetical protein pqer_cds_1112 [Pandoravirus quercus]|uniref:Uncharacterized protein n=1 Tax=Pandoravirus quercus TaxID=2107709 RepID=A0A2U7UAS0_9VIRU|nr:hypothetical protein pqer_cds_1112 [Pandoravirus quercus]AVK75534.1 hypothetical protein pqer_cds_1112 [Pandoravirus quercus]